LTPTDAQRPKLCELMHHAIVEIRLLGSAEKTIEKPLSALRYGDTTR